MENGDDLGHNSNLIGAWNLRHTKLCYCLWRYDCFFYHYYLFTPLPPTRPFSRQFVKRL